MSITCRIPLLWVLVLLLKLIYCDVVEEGPSNPDGSSLWLPGAPDTAENMPYPNSNLSVPTPTVSNPDGLAGQDGGAGQGPVTTVLNTVTSTITPPPVAMPGTCQIGNCTATASVRRIAPGHRKSS